MTPRELDGESIVAKIRAMRRLLDQLMALGPVDRQRFEEDFGAQLVAERVVSQLVDLAAAINTHVATVELHEAPHDLTQSFTLAARAGLIDKQLAEALAPSTGLRNILIHVYLELDLDKFVAAIPLAIDQYGEYVRKVARWLQQRAESV
jgi:uncharacterized protein YutE (UPF0331/DUF86 family)